MKNLTKLDKILLSLAILIFILVSSLVIFKRDWLDDIVFGPRQESVSITSEEVVEEDVYVETIPLINVDMTAQDGEASVVLYFEKGFSITGVELFLEKDVDLDIGEMVCEPPFECFLFDVEENKISFIAIIPAEYVESFEEGEVLLGKFTYEGTGKLYLNSDSQSFAADIEDPEFNILNVNEKEFLF